MIPRRRIVGVLVAAATLVGCTSTPVVTPTPLPQPSYSCTPEAGGTAYPCSQREYEEMRAKEQQYVEAESVYRESVRLREEALAEGHADTLALEGIADGQALDNLRTELENGSRLDGAITVPWINRMAGATRESSTVALESCIVAAGTFTTRSGAQGNGYTGIERTYYRAAGDAIKMVYIEAKLVDEC